MISIFLCLKTALLNMTMSIYFTLSLYFSIKIAKISELNIDIIQTTSKIRPPLPDLSTTALGSFVFKCC